MKEIKVGLVIGLVALSMSFASVSNSQDLETSEPPLIDPATPGLYDLGVCLTAEQLDCIESVEIANPTGSFQRALSDRAQVWTVSQDRNGNQQYFGTLYWILPGSSPTAKEYFGVSARITTPQHTWDDGTKVSSLRVSVDDLAVGNIAKVTIRTSWMRAQNLQFNAVAADFSHSEIPGGNLWTFTGAHAKISNYTSEEGWSSNWSNKADVDYMSLGFTIHHAGPSIATSWWDPRCAHTGYTAQAFNAPGAGSPEWDNVSQSLQFNIGAPHLDSQGNQNIGFFRLWVSESFANCQWPDNNLVDADDLVATIFNDDGSIQDADVKVWKSNGMIFLDAKNFHYSAPRFQITAKGTPIKPSLVPNNIITSPAPSKSSNLTSPEKTSSPISDDIVKATKDSPMTEKETEKQESNNLDSAWIIPAVTIALITVVGGLILEFFRRKRLS